MAVLTETVVYRGGMRGSGLKYLVMEVSDATAADTVTVGELDAIKDTIAFRLDTGAEVDCTEATNVVTIGSGPSATPMLIIVSGW
jgi:hypothetical protein